MLSKSHLTLTLTAASLIFSGLLVVTAALPLAAQHSKKPAPPKTAGHAAKPDAALVALGKKIYDAQGCAGCHAIGGKGGSAGPDLTQTGAAPAHTPQWLAVQVANPKAHNPGTTMPAFAKTIQGKNLTALSVYLASLKGSSAGSTASPTGSHSAGTGPDPAAVARIEKLGGRVEPLAQNDDHLDVSLHLGGAAVTDASLAALNGMKNVVHLDLGQTAITDAGLNTVKNLKGLTELHLEGTRITDAGLVSLEGLHDLTYLNLYGTGITDAGLDHLSHLTNLRHLYVWQTKVTDDGVNKLKKALPQLEVVQGVEPAAPKK